MQNVSYENEFDLHENELVGETNFQNKDFALRLVLTQKVNQILKMSYYFNKFP